MRTRPKDLGTAHETRIVRAAQAAGLVAERIAEAGPSVRCRGHRLAGRRHAHCCHRVRPTNTQLRRVEEHWEAESNL